MPPPCRLRAASVPYPVLLPHHTLCCLCTVSALFRRHLSPYGSAGRNGGGRFILTTPYHGYLKNLSIALAGKADRHYSALWEGGHIKFWSRRTLAILLREAGFRNMAFTGAGRIPYLWRHMVFSAEAPAAAEVRACDPAAEP